MDATAPESFRSGMLATFGAGFFLLGLPIFFRNLRMEDHSAERIRRAAERGPVVYVLHTRSVVDWLALNRVLVARGLPLPVFTNGVDATFWMPLAEQWRALTRRFRGETPAFDPMSTGWLADCIASGRPTCLFLQPQQNLVDLVVRRDEPDPIAALLDAQARTDLPVQVIPIVVIANRSPEPAQREVGSFLIGLEDIPGSLGKLTAIATQGNALVQAGEAIPLTEYVARYKDEPPARRKKMLRLALRRWLYREARVVRGPRARPYGHVRRVVLESRELTDLVPRESAATGRSPEKIRAEVAKQYDKMAASFSFPVVQMSAAVCKLVWNRIYSGIDVREEDLDRIREALRKGTPILVPCHRSHLDYLLISCLLFEHDIVIPHIVAGDNLSFWPLGSIFRRCGAFFIRRSFSGDRIFPVLFARYLKELVHMEVPIEFFIEGGRSRTGKLLPPKVGVFGMLMDAAASVTRSDREVSFLPIYIGYEQIAEERAYARELSGVRKEKESVQQVVKATGVLKNRYGKVYLRVGEALTAREIATGDDWSKLSKDRRHELLLAGGERLLHRINTEAVALPTAIVALAILSHARRGLRHAELKARVVRVRAFLAAAKVQEGGGMSHVDGIIDEALGRFVGGRLLTGLEEEHGRVYSIVPERRVTLEYYKNTVLHAFAPAAFYAGAVRALGAAPKSGTAAELPSALGPGNVDRAAVSRLFRLQQFLLRYEFVLDPDANEETLESRAIVGLTAYGALTTSAEGVLQVADRGRVGEIANLVANFLESYQLVLRAAKNAKGPLAAKDLSRDALAFGKTLLAVDEISRPEALNLVNLENAVRAFAEDGVLRRLADGRLELVPDLANPYAEALGQLLGIDPATGS
ncbi:MAG: 1-acyl-sn-glycerol-3-phosphate acyltransferase [Pseudomonadota bacterium]|nr:1-acyl-sn-glycerol-3-phosphate acyltransferase [Pseudomonadota bacterium]